VFGLYFIIERERERERERHKAKEENNNICNHNKRKKNNKINRKYVNKLCFVHFHSAVGCWAIRDLHRFARSCLLNNKSEFVLSWNFVSIFIYLNGNLVSSFQHRTFVTATVHFAPKRIID
jgi:hypothetical protein